MIKLWSKWTLHLNLSTEEKIRSQSAFVQDMVHRFRFDVAELIVSFYLIRNKLTNLC